MRRLSIKRVGVGLALLVSASACTGTDGGLPVGTDDREVPASTTTITGATTTASTTTTTGATSTTTTTTVSVFVDPMGTAKGILHIGDEPGRTLVRGALGGVAEGEMRIEVADVLADADSGRGWAPGDTVVVRTYSGRDMAIGEVLAAYGGSLPVLVLVDSDGVGFPVPLEAGMLRFSRDETTQPLNVFSTSNTLARRIDDGDMHFRPIVQIDPDEYTYCQDLTPDLVEFEVGDDEVADLIAFIGQAVAADQFWVGIGETRSRVDARAIQASGWVTDVLDQVLRGVPVADAIVHPTVRSRLVPGDLTWLEQGATVVWAEAGSGRVLGWTDYGGYTVADAPLRGDTVEVMVPPTGGDIEIYLRGDHPLPLCIQPGDQPYVTVPFEEFAGSGRARVLLDTANYKPWNPSN